ncbi:hypothetical protein DSM112329_00366 [Paraconexibacter sp. AEG42_29]|uniref:Mce/MlaD domain-containing protein n=1 Tax=Paraconexibacter sp. AEG42_29 TaxID=2997339 RepID=A0AAU7AQA4_9ACTN
MTARNLIPAALGAVLVIVLVMVFTGGSDDDRYRFQVQLDNALGLRDGSLITVGGVEVGTVKVKLQEDQGDKVLVTGRLDDGQGPIGAGASASVTSVNLLGQKRLELDKGRLSSPQPSGTRLATSSVTPSTDLDEVLAVLTPEVRQRLNILVGEAGAAVVGRSGDIGQLIDTLPSTIDKANKVVEQVAGDNSTLTKLVANSDKVVRDVTAERQALVELVDSAGQASASAATKRTQLRATLAQAPGMLASLRGFLTELQQTTVPLGPAARDIKGTAPELLATLRQVAPFQKAAAPTLDQATEVAPSLTRLATGATPVLRQATPVVGRAATFANDLVPITNTLDKSVDNLVGTVDNWSRAVQYRDGLSHIFRGEAAVTPQTLESMLIRYLGKDAALPASIAPPTKRKGGASAPSVKPVDKAKSLLPKVEVPQLPAVQKVLDGVLGTVDKTLKGAGDTVKGLTDGLKGLGSSSGNGRTEPPPASSSSQSLLDFLLKP